MIKNIINILRKITGYNELLRDYNKQYERILQYEEVINNLEQELKNLTKKIDKLEQEKQSLEDQLSDMLENNKVDVLELRDWYEGRRRSEPWKYDGGRLGYTDVKYYLRPSDMKPFTELAEKLIDENDLDGNSNPTDVVTIMYKYWNKKSSWTYKYDKELYNKADYWEDPTESMLRRTGDCESKSFCMLNTTTEMLRLLALSEHEWRLTFTASVVAGEGGHGYLTWLYDDGEYYVVESTYYNRSSFNKTWLKTPIRFNNLYQDLWGFSTKEKSWRTYNSALTNFKDV